METSTLASPMCIKRPGGQPSLCSPNHCLLSGLQAFAYVIPRLTERQGGRRDSVIATTSSLLQLPSTPWYRSPALQVRLCYCHDPDHRHGLDHVLLVCLTLHRLH